MTNPLALISCPYGEAGLYLGAEEGPKALLGSSMINALSILGYEVALYHLPFRKPLNSSWANGLHNLPTLIQSIESLKKTTFEVLQKGLLPCIIGGDHSLSIGSISGIMKYCQQTHKKLFVLWFDAHADCNTPQTSSSGNFHGMPVAHLCGWGEPLVLKIIGKENFLNPAQIYFFGLRSIDLKEKDLLKDNPFHVFDMETLTKKGFLPVLKKTLEHFHKQTDVHVHISFDIDVLDASLVPGTGTPVEKGLTLWDMQQAFIELHTSNLVHSLDIMELNPLRDLSGQTTKDIAELIPFLFGKSL